MSRRKKAIYIPQGSTELQEKFINYIMLDGKKTLARRILENTFEIMAKRGIKKPEQEFEKAIENVKPTLEVRPKRIGGAVYQIPVEVTPKRKVTLACRWILAAARSKKNKNTADALATELMDAANKEGAAMKKREDTHKMAQANRAFAHYARF